MNAVRCRATLAMLPLVAVFVVSLVAGCGGDRLAAPRVRADATLEATLVRLPDGTVSAQAVATNAGNVTIHYGWSCVFGGIDMSVHGPKGEIRLHDPCTSWPACPDGFVPLAPGEHVERYFSYAGGQYGDTCHSLQPIPPGRYEVVARFTWYSGSYGSPTTTRTRRLPFDWPAP